MVKDTYLFSEILIGLRSEYIKNQKLLNEEKKCIQILNNNFEIDCPIDKPTELSINEDNNGIVLKKKNT